MGPMVFAGRSAKLKLFAQHEVAHRPLRSNCEELRPSKSRPLCHREPTSAPGAVPSL